MQNMLVHSSWHLDASKRHTPHKQVIESDSDPSLQQTFLFFLDCKNLGYESRLITEKISFWAVSNVSLANWPESMALLTSSLCFEDKFTCVLDWWSINVSYMSCANDFTSLAFSSLLVWASMGAAAVLVLSSSSDDLVGIHFSSSNFAL